MHSKKEIMKALNLNQDIKFVEENLIFLALSGSHAYGLNNSDSDFDYRGITIPPIDYFLTAKNFEQREDKTNDITIYSIVKIFQLAKNANPNILELFFLSSDSIIYKHPIMDRLLENKHLFLSKKVQYSFSGYAFSQLHRIIGHKKWLDNPVEKPNRLKMGLPYNPKINKEKIYSLAVLSKEELKSFLQIDQVDYIFQEVEYYEQQRQYEHYINWQSNRNEKRSVLEEKYHYDSKHAMHLMRLIRVAKEIAIEKTMHTKRPDCDFLMDIRNGKYTYEEIINMAEREEKEIHELFQQSDLPNSVDYDALDKLLLGIIKDFFCLIY